MGKADLRLSDEARSRPVTARAPEPITTEREAAANPTYQVRARRFGLLLMVASSVVTLAVIVGLWMIIAGAL
jgi:hypothetical protein